MTLQLTALCFLSHSNTLVFIPIQGVGEGGIGMAVAPLDNGGQHLAHHLGCWKPLGAGPIQIQKLFFFPVGLHDLPGVSNGPGKHPVNPALVPSTAA